MLKILFMGTPDFAKESLKALYEANYNIVGVVTNLDKPKGRGMKLIASPVKEYALEKNIPIYQPAKIKNNKDFIDLVKQIDPDLICVVAYGKILPKDILDIPKMGCINVHASLLPKYRGAAPIQWAVINGDKKTGVTTMYMDESMDTGDMLLKEEVDIGENETTGELWNKLSVIGAKLLVKTIKNLEEGNIKREKQIGQYSLAPMLDKEIGNIDWKNKSAIEIKNLIRGLNPIMGAYSYLNNKKIKFWKAEAYTTEQVIKKFKELEGYEYRLQKVEPGTVLFSNPKQGLYIKTKNDIISIIEIQGENAKKMDVKDFLLGNKIDAGSVFEYKI